MSDTTKIEWANHTGGPLFGCSPVSPGCANCYAWELAETRLENLFRRAYKNAGFTDWETRPVWGNSATRVRSKGFWVDAIRINKMHAARGTRGRWFPSMIDWLDTMPGGIIDLNGQKLEPVAVLAEFLKLIHDTPSIDWLLLTKRAENWYKQLLNVCAYQAATGALNVNEKVFYWIDDWLKGRPPQNVAVGASMEDQPRVNERMEQLVRIPARTRFISAEPLLGPLEFSDVSKRADAVHRLGRASLEDIHWVIVGGESGHKARPCNVEWIRSIVRQCKTANVDVFVKQLGAFVIEERGSSRRHILLDDSKGGKMDEWEEDLRVREYPTALRPG
jgi:protein gp37